MIAKHKLAKQYFPQLTRQKAVRKLSDWIRRCPALQQKLQTLGYQPKAQSFTSPQVEAIYEFLGEP